MNLDFSKITNLKLSKPSSREIKLSLAMLIGSTAMVAGVWWFTRSETPSVSQIPSLTEKKVAVAEPAPSSPQAKAKPYNLKPQANPFSSLNATAKNGTLPPAPAMPAVPVNLAAPAAKQDRTDSATGRKGLHVTSVFVGQSGRNIAILSDGKTQVTAREGKECKFGYVDEISKEGVSVGGRWIEVSKDALAPEEIPVQVAIRSDSLPQPPPQPGNPSPQSVQPGNGNGGNSNTLNSNPKK